MKIFFAILTITLSLANLASAGENLKFVCDNDFNSYKENTFTGSGVISADLIKENKTSQAQAFVTVNMKSKDSKVEKQLELEGTLFTIEAGALMKEESYSIELKSESQKATMAILLKGPGNQSTAKLKLGGMEYYSHCDLIVD